jgi:phosphoribosylaminoimidazole (AIR) synthetase
MVRRRCRGLHENGYEAVVKLLLEKGAELESKDKDLWSDAAIVGCTELA